MLHSNENISSNMFMLKDLHMEPDQKLQSYSK